MKMPALAVWTIWSVGISARFVVLVLMWVFIQGFLNIWKHSTCQVSIFLPMGKNSMPTGLVSTSEIMFRSFHGRLAVTAADQQ